MKLTVTCGALKNVPENSKIIGLASINIGGFLTINSIKIIKGKGGKLFVGMPSTKTNKGQFIDICYFTNEKSREYVENKIIESFLNK